MNLNALDRHIIGNYGWDALQPCVCGLALEDHNADGTADGCDGFDPADPPERDPDEDRYD